MTDDLIALADWDDPTVQKIYEILCSTEGPSNPEEHWEGWLARRITAALDLDTLTALQARAEKAEAERDALRDALRFYADPENFVGRNWDDWNPADLDNGSRARTALKSLERT